MKDEEQEETKK